MNDTKKQPWPNDTASREIRWRQRRAFNHPYKRSPNLSPYTDIIRKHMNDVDQREAGMENHECDLEYVDAHHHYLLHFQENLAYIRDWKQYEQLELLIQLVDLGKTTIPWLRQFREDLDLKV